MNQIKVHSVNISEKKGTIKLPVRQIELTENGVEGDAHSGPWNRQVSLLGTESISRFEHAAGRKIGHGEFAENITTGGMELWKCNPLDRFSSDTVELEVTQIGKECHGNSCSIFKEVGNCVMPKEGIFARVIRAGNLKAGDSLSYLPKTYDIQVITLSDRACAGLYDDLSGPRIIELLKTFFTSHSSLHNIRHSLLPDDPVQLRDLLTASIENRTDIVVTTGGTGLGPKDFTPDVIRPLLDKEIPGLMEHIRLKYGAEKPNALLSRSIAGVSGNTLVFSLPGSVRAVSEYMEEILKSLMHMIYMVHALDFH